MVGCGNQDKEVQFLPVKITKHFIVFVANIYQGLTQTETVLNTILPAILPTALGH